MQAVLLLVLLAFKLTTYGSSSYGHRFSLVQASADNVTIDEKLLTTTIATNKTIDERAGRICGAIHIRNDLKSFRQLEGCRIINGPLTIALVSSVNNPKDFDNITFPLLTEITDHLLLFRVHNLTTLSRLFPNLRIIRGRDLVGDYALIIYEMMHLQRIDLPNLTDILRGSVRIEGNPFLCYAKTVNWDGICKSTFRPHYFKDNNKHCNDRCPDHCQPWAQSTQAKQPTILGEEITQLGAVNNQSLFCWNGLNCHNSCIDNDGNNLIRAPDGGCCSPLCAGGCYKKNQADQCISCRHVSHKDKCVLKCDPSLYEFEGQCLEQDQCEKLVREVPVANQCTKNQGRKEFKAVRLNGYGRCQGTCPSNYEEDPTNRHKCKACDKGKCRKICSPQDQNKLYLVTNVNSLKELSQCNVIDGSLEIAIKGSKSVLGELEETFKDLEEISGYLKITRSYPLLTLNFLRGLKFINGTTLDRGQYSLVIIDNPNLQELFVFDSKEADQHKHLAILGGKIFVHLNPKLCPRKINNLKQYATVADWSDQDVSIHTNGDKEACETKELKVELVHSSAHHAVIKFQNFAAQLDDPRSLLFYLINYREASSGTVTMFDGRDGCNSQNDVWIQVEENPSKVTLNTSIDDYQRVIIDVKPATRYALYVKTFTILAGSTGALSEMIYFETAPDTPGIPRDLKGNPISSSRAKITWKPPSKPNGKISHYMVIIKKVDEDQGLQQVDVCGSIDGRDTIARKISHTEPSLSHLVPPEDAPDRGQSSNNSTSCKPERMGSETSPEGKLDKYTFQDMVIDIVYLKYTCSSTNSNVPAREIIKRSIEHDPSEAEGNSENSLPRKPVRANQSSPRAQPVDITIPFNNSNYKTEKKLVAPSDELFSYELTNLEHFKLYQIEVIACHGDFSGVKSKTSSTYSKCSLNAVTQIRTHAVPEYDKVNASTIMFYPANETDDNAITWEKPLNPNGLALAYRVRYKLKNADQDVWREVCINNKTYTKDKGLTLSNIGPGVYVLSVQTISMYTEHRLWSDEIEFEIPQTSIVSPLAWTFIVIATLILIALGVAFGAYYTQKKSARDDLIYASVNPDYVQYNPDEWEVDKSNLIVGQQIGTGSFGMVYKGQLITEKGIRDCAVKTVPPTSTAKQRFDFLREASIMKQFDTFHVVKLLGVISVTTPVYVIMEYMEIGDLKDFLRKQRESYYKQGKFLVDGVYLMAAQIADGMAYLASKKFVHRDLAARNCMVGENRIVKIGDFGLTRDIYANDYYRRDTQGRLPVRWMAPESLSDNICTTASDVWSYGVVLWEIVTFSASPYQGLSNDEVIKRVISGYTMERPDHCTDKLFTIMERCWRKVDKDRPTFLDIVEYLLPETEGKLYPNCYYRKPKIESDSNAHTNPHDSNTGTESYPLLSWPSSNRANGLTNGDNHIMNHNNTSDHGGK